MDTFRLLCEPMLYVNGTPESTLPQDGLITPCGLQAWSYFNDTFQFSIIPGPDGSNSSSTPQILEVDDNNIAWPSDSQFLYGNVTTKNFNIYPPQRGGGALANPLNQEQHFMVWMRLASKPTFWKLWGVINRELKAGDTVLVEIVNQYNTYGFRGAKSIVLSTNSWLGNRNFFLGALYVGVGGAFIICSCLFQIAYWIKPRAFGDENHLSWNRMK